MWYLFKNIDLKVNDKDNRTGITHCYGVSIVDFEHVLGWNFKKQCITSGEWGVPLIMAQSGAAKQLINFF